MTKLTLTEAIEYVNKWNCLKFGPTTPEGVETIAEEFVAMVGTHENAQWLSNRIIKGCSSFPTPIEMRRILANHCKPADGLEPYQVDNEDFMSGGGGKQSE